MECIVRGLRGPYLLLSLAYGLSTSHAKLKSLSWYNGLRVASQRLVVTQLVMYVLH